MYSFGLATYQILMLPNDRFPRRPMPRYFIRPHFPTVGILFVLYNTSNV